MEHYCLKTVTQTPEGKGFLIFFFFFLHYKELIKKIYFFLFIVKLIYISDTE